MRAGQLRVTALVHVREVCALESSSLKNTIIIIVVNSALDVGTTNQPRIREGIHWKLDLLC